MLILDFHPFPVIQTERLILREVGYLDAEEIYEQRSHPQIMQYIDRPRATSVQEATEQFTAKIKEGLATNSGITWAISLKTNPKLIGTIGFWRIMKESYRAEIGYALHPDHWRQGLMQEAVEATLDYGFKTMKLHSIEANVNPNNLASIKLLERNKFVKEAHFKENWFFDGKFLDSAVYSLVNTI